MSTTNKTIGFGILGAGMIANFHKMAVESNADIGAKMVAIGHYNPERFDAISEEFGLPCMSEADLLAHPDIDVICLCTPSGQHPAQTIAAAKAGKHVIVEKPIALNLADADAMIAACEEAGVKLGVALQRRAEPHFQRVYSAIEAGDFGELTLGSVLIPYHRPQAYYDQAEWRGTWDLDGGGVLMNQGVHLVDLLVWFMGDPVETKAFAQTAKRDIEVEDLAAATMRFENGGYATITATTTTDPGFPHRVEIYGTKGGVQIEGDVISQWLLANPDEAQVEPFVSDEVAEAGAASDPRGIKATGHINIFRDFIECLREDRPPAIDGAEGRRSLAAVLQVYEAAGIR
ncbi:MAG: Gfo/Idh/MocA family oxidoreductase [Chloroflexota bacterium]